eukprot:g4519.t1
MSSGIELTIKPRRAGDNRRGGSGSKGRPRVRRLTTLPCTVERWRVNANADISGATGTSDAGNNGMRQDDEEQGVRGDGEGALGTDSGRALRFVLHQGLNRQIRRMCESRGLQVKRLHRTRFAGVGLDGLAGPGDWLPCSDEEIGALKQALPAGE